MQKGDEIARRIHPAKPTKTTSAKSSPVAYAFMYINSPDTKRQYPKHLKQFFDFAGIEGGTDLEQQGQAFLEQAKEQGSEWVAHNIMLYLNHHKERVLRNEIAPGTLKNLYRPIKTFCDTYPEVFDSIPWKRILKAMPRAKPYSNDRSPTLEELRKLVGFPDHRIKPIVYVMASSGIRVGAWDWLKWRHVTPISDPKTGKVIAAKLLVYAGTGDEYMTFMTPEAYNSLKEWMDFRARFGEKITGDSWLMRNIWKTVDVKVITRTSKLVPKGKNHYSKVGTGSDGESFGYKCSGEATNPIKLPSAAIKHILLRALYVQGIRSELLDGANRHEFKGAHGMRKFFKTRAEYSGANRGNIEYLMGHSLGVSSSYLKPSDHELLTDYLKTVPALTINDTNVESLKEQQESLEQKYKEKDKELEDLKERLKRFEDTTEKTMHTMFEMLASKLKNQNE